MHITELTAFVVTLRLRRPFKHASATRQESENLIIRCRLADGTEGWGEGVPRSYVTGETCDGAIEQLRATPLADQLGGSCQSWDDAIQLGAQFELAAMRDDPRGCYGNALRCAVELSMLDAYGRLFQEPLSCVTQRYPLAAPLRERAARVRYSTTISAESPRSERLSALKMRLYGFRQCKVKVGVPQSNDAQRLARIRTWIGSHVDLRLDANEAWSSSQAAAKIEPLLAYHISCVEQPTPHAEVSRLADLRREISVPLMLDESLTSLADAREAIRLRTCDLFNIRLSKCGGFLRSLQLAALAQEAGLGYQLGCHPGESAILSAAGRHWATSVREIRYLEGSYDRHLLQRFITPEDITFGYGGWAPALAGPGLGITVDAQAVEEMTHRKETFQVA